MERMRGSAARVLLLELVPHHRTLRHTTDAPQSRSRLLALPKPAWACCGAFNARAEPFSKLGHANSLRRTSPGADVAGVSPVLAWKWQG
jgi:hypothetical protein